MIRTDRARAKINLTLHVGAAIDQPGHVFHDYHPLDSLVVFADMFDEITCQPASRTQLDIQGPFATHISQTQANLIWRAYEAVNAKVSCPNIKINVVKNLPVAAGLGGGSADAAAMLRLLQNWVNLDPQTWVEIALELGADVPACLSSKTCHMSGIGEHITPLSSLGQLPALLVNPGEAVSTAEVFQAYDKTLPSPLQSEGINISHMTSLLDYAKAGRNDLEKSASEICPIIRDILSAIASQYGCELARMSGSGATCFGLFQTRQQAERAAQTLHREHPSWWVKPCWLGDRQ